MTSSNCLRSRDGPFGSGSRSVTAPFGAAFAAFARSAFSAFSDGGALSAFGVFSPLGFLSSLSAIDLSSRPLGKADLLVAHHLEPDARRLAVLRIGKREVRQMDRGLLGDDAAFLARALLL